MKALKILLGYVALSYALTLYSNEPASVAIYGPHKIFTNDQVVYSASVNGGNNVTVGTKTWSVDNHVQATGETFTFTAPSSSGNPRITCSIQITENGHSRPISGDKDVTVVEPQITVSRVSFLESTFASESTAPSLVTINQSGTAIIHKNIMQKNTEKLALNISILPNDVCVQDFELTTSNTDSLFLYSYGDLSDPISLPFTISLSPGYFRLSDLSSDYFNLRVEGNHCGTGLSVKLKINNNEKLTLPYVVYGIENSNFRGHVTNRAADFYQLAYPNLVDNEWGIDDVAFPVRTYYNCFAYAIKNPPFFNNKYFRVLAVADSSWSVNSINFTNAFIPLPNSSNVQCYATSLDTLGNNNGVFDAPDVDLFFMNDGWGSDKMVSSNPGSIAQSKILFYNTNNNPAASNPHAVRKSNRTEGCYPDWHMFEGKMGEEEILIHRGEQLKNSVHGNILKKYK